MPRTHTSPDVFHALAHPTRRAILDRLRAGSAPVAELAANFDMSRAAVGKHLHVLRAAGLVRARRDGTRRVHRLTPEPLAAVASWVARHRRPRSHRAGPHVTGGQRRGSA